MALNQATNITPSLSGAFSGSGTADVEKGLTVSWQVNGQSPMTAYRVIIYENDAASTQMYSTGKVVLSEPFYGKDALGNFRFFSFTISADELASAGVENGGEYKLTITQWWGSADAESVTQSSAAAFLARSSPELTLNAIPSPVSSRKHSFTAAYSQEQGDALNWVRWMIAAAGETDNPIYDSGNIYTALLECTYDGFFSGQDYMIRAQVQTVNGVEADTGWVSFSVYYAVSPLTGFVRTRCLPGKDAVEVSWPKIASIPGSAYGIFEVRAGKLSLANGAVARWSSVNGESMRFPAPFFLIWKGTLNYADMVGEDVFRVVTLSGAISMYCVPSTGKIGVRVNGESICMERSLPPDNVEVTMILTADMVYWRITYAVGQLFPSETLYPSENLFPSAGDPQTELHSESVSYPQSEIITAELYGKQVCDFFEISDGSPEQSVISSAWETGTYIPAFTEKTEMLADFSNGLQAGVITQEGANVTGYTVYRQRADQRLLRVGEFRSGVRRIIDHTIRNRQGAYKWSVIAVDGSEVLTDAMESEEINPCFWDWVLLSCTDTSDGYCLVNAAFRFRLNVETGSVSNNNEPAVYKNFTRYPTIMTAPQNYRSGTLTGLIGYVDYSGGEIQYTDSIALRDAISDLSVSSDRLFLRNRKGDLLEIRISGPVSMETMDASTMQAQTVSLPWTEIADASDVSLISFEDV